MASLFASNQLPLTICEYTLLFSELGEILNRRPIEGQIHDNSIQFISPNSLLLGRTSKFQPIVTPPKIEENRIRLKIISTFKSQFWDLYIKSLAGNSTLFKYQNWYKQNRIPQVGDIVLIAYHTSHHSQS